MKEYPYGYSEQEFINYRISMYREFNKQNPQVAGIAWILTLISIFRLVVSVAKILMWLWDIDQILIRQYRVRQEDINDDKVSPVVFSPELESYIKRII